MPRCCYFVHQTYIAWYCVSCYAMRAKVFFSWSVCPKRSSRAQSSMCAPCGPTMLVFCLPKYIALCSPYVDRASCVRRMMMLIPFSRCQFVQNDCLVLCLCVFYIGCFFHVCCICFIFHVCCFSFTFVVFCFAFYPIFVCELYTRPRSNRETETKQRASMSGAQKYSRTTST